MEEITCNIHIHSTFSDGSGSYSSISEAAAAANLDVIILTDHNVWVKGYEGYYQHQGKSVLVLTGEEVHNQDRDPQKNHMLVLGAETEVAADAYDPTKLINTIHKHHGLSFLAHQDETDLKLVHETDISWVDWQVDGYDGFEIWNHMSEFKTRSQKTPDLIRNVLTPEMYAVGPLQVTLNRWDELLVSGKRLTAIGGSDSHMLKFNLGKVVKWIFPYQFHFSCINNHLLLTEKLNGDLKHDKALIYAALKSGSSFIGYDLPAQTRGFSFNVYNEAASAGIGQEIDLTQGATIQVRLPSRADIHLIKNGKCIYQSTDMDRLAYPVNEGGVYRIECYRDYQGQKRGWIFSNPIYMTKKVK
jgi:hypothetical protein